ncbi:uracil-DNA glycosylase [Yangia sp. PrR003]|nr:uracil-DNA glycosylase [Salipiger sp. PrR003]
MTPAAPRSLSNPRAITERRQLLTAPHMAPLTEFVETLRGEGRGAVPDFDPLDGGIEATILFLMEKPGPMTDDTAIAGRVGSGFISRDNDDPTAAATFSFMQQAGIDRRQSILWNTVPWWNGTRKIAGEEMTAGLNRLGSLLDLLPGLKAVVAVGGRASKASSFVKSRGLHLILSAHPSPINRAARPAVWEGIPAQWAEAKRYL